MRIASLSFHLVVPERADATKIYGFAEEKVAKHLWAYTLADAAARACLLSLDAPFTGHEVFYIVAPDTVMDMPTLELAATLLRPIRRSAAISSGRRSFFNSSKAERMLGWRHTPD